MARDGRLSSRLSKFVLSQDGAHYKHAWLCLTTEILDYARNLRNKPIYHNRLQKLLTFLIIKKIERRLFEHDQNGFLRSWKNLPPCPFAHNSDMLADAERQTLSFWLGFVKEMVTNQTRLATHSRNTDILEAIKATFYHSPFSASIFWRLLWHCFDITASLQTVFSTRYAGVMENIDGIKYEFALSRFHLAVLSYSHTCVAVGGIVRKVWEGAWNEL